MKKYLLIEINVPESAKDLNRNDVNTYRFDDTELERRLAELYGYFSSRNIDKIGLPGMDKAKRILFGK